MSKSHYLKKSDLTPVQKALLRRYLVWCFKTTREDLDRIDRYYTQNIVDCFMLEELKAASNKDDLASSQKIAEFEKYRKQKLANADQKKYLDKTVGKLTAEYLYLQNRFTAIQKAIKRFLGVKELKVINDLYEREMTRRILEAREHT